MQQLDREAMIEEPLPDWNELLARFQIGGGERSSERTGRRARRRA